MLHSKFVGTVRSSVTRWLAACAMMAVSCLGTVAVTGGLMTASVTSADAYWRGRGGRGRGWGGRGWRSRGWRGRGHYVCRHRYWTSRRACWWVR